MEQSGKKNKRSANKEFTFISGRTEMGALIHTHHWASTPIGIPETWPHTLHTLLNIMLNAKEPMCIVWGSEHIMFYNDPYAEVLAHKHPSALGRSFFEVWSELEEEFRLMFDQAYAGVPVHGENLHHRNYSEETHFSYSLTPVHDEHGKVDGIFCTCTGIMPADIREDSLQTTEEVLHEREAILHSIVDQAVVGIAQADLNLRLMYVNDRYCKITGRTREELLNMRVDEITHSEDLSRNIPLLEKMGTTGESFVIEKRYIRPDGSIAWAMNSVNPIFDIRGQVVGSTAAVIDITERKQAEEALQKLVIESEQQARIHDTLLSTIEDGVYIVDRKGRYLYSNKANLQFLGLDRVEEILGKSLADLNIPDKLREKGLQAYEQVIRTRQSASDFVYYTNLAGEERYLEYIMAPVFSPEGQVEAIAGSTRDITARKRKEQHENFLAELNAEFMRLSSSEEIMQVVGDKIGQYLGVSNVFFAELDDTAAYATTIYAMQKANMPVALGIYRFSDYMTEAYLNELKAGQTLAVADVATDARTASFADTYTLFQVRSQIHAPYLSDGRWKFLLTVQRHEPYQWRKDEIQLISKLSALIWQRLERIRAEEALRVSEERYRSLFNSMDEGFCLLEILFDENNNARDGRLLEINLSFEEQTGLRGVIGKTALELVPALEQHWIDNLGKVALTGEPLRFVENSEASGGWFEVYAFRLGRPASRKVALLFKDITERKQTQDALRMSEQRARLAIEIANLGTWRIDTARENVYMDRRMREIWGIPEGTECIPMSQAVERIHPEDREWVMKAIADTMEAKSSSVDFMEYRIVWDDGSVRWVSARGLALFEERAQHSIALTGIMLDITERKKAEEALRESEVRLRRAIEIETVGIIFFKTDGVIISSNDAFLQMSGYSHDDIEKGLVHWDKMTPPEWMPRSLEAIKELITSGRTTPYEKEYIRKDGSRFWALFAATLLNEEEGVEFILDITERKQAEEALRQSEERYRLINRATNDVIWDWDIQGNRLDWNEAAAVHFGYTLEELGRTINDWYEHVHPDDRERIVADIRRAIDEGAESWTGEYLFRKYDGSYATILDRGYIARDVNGKAFRMIGTMLDLTERAKMEEVLRQAKEEAERAAHAKEEFLAHMSHEIRTPLNAVVGLANLLLQQDPKADQLENLQTLKFSAENLMVLVNDILDFSKIQAGKVVVQETAVNLPELLNSLQKVHQPRAVEQGDELQFHLDKQIPKVVYTDQLKLSQILHNLVSNAVKFTRQGLVTVEVSLSSRQEERLWVDFSVSDTGVGVPEDKLSTIFDAFTQADNTTVRQYGGTGLGLSITKLLLELMGSRIEVESREGKGSRFFFTLPMRESDPTEVPLDEESIKYQEGQSDLQHIRLLLVEDVDINRMIIKQFLLDWWQLQPDEAANGQQALEMAQAVQYDLILMDVRMPMMDGYQAAQAIKALTDKDYQHVPIIALTADTVQEVEKHPEAALFADVITKPFDPLDLRQKLIQYAPTGKMQPASDSIQATVETPADLSLATLPYQVDVKKLDVFFKGDTQSMAQFLEKAIREFHSFRQRFAKAMHERDETTLTSIKHKANVLLHILALDDVNTLLEHCQFLLRENAAEDELRQSQQKVEAIVEQALVSLQERLAQIQ